jgi:hypothetical protein
VTDTVSVFVDSGALETLTLIDADGTAATTSVILGYENDYDAIGTLAGSTTQYYMSDRDLSYSSSDTDVGVIGLNTGILSTGGIDMTTGTTQLIVNHAASGVNSAGLNVQVIDAVAEGIACRPGWLQRTPDDTVNFVVEILMSNGDTPAIIDGSTEANSLSFVSGNTAVADFLDGSPLGLATALEIGVATVTVTWIDPVGSETFTDTCDVEVVEELSIPGTCSDAMGIFAEDQVLYGSTENAGDDNDGDTDSADDNGGEDVFYTFTLEDPATLDLSVLFPVEGGWAINPIVSTGCTDSNEVDLVDSGTDELICLPSGTYYLIVDGETEDDWGAFEIDLDFEYGCVPGHSGSSVVDPAA